MVGSLGLLVTLMASTAMVAPSDRDTCAAAARYITPDNPLGVEWDKLDPAVAIPACEKAVSADPRDHASRANLARALLKAERVEEGTAQLRLAAEGGSPQAQRQLGLRHYSKDEGVTPDAKAAFALMKRAAEAGYGPAAATLATFHAEGFGTPANDEQAVFWHRRAHEAGEHVGTLNLGRMLEEGRGAPKNVDEANRLYRIAADAGEATAMYYLGLNYLNGIGFQKNVDEAIRWLEKAVAGGQSDAYGDLGLIYEQGIGGTVDPVTAAKWYRHGSEAGDHRSTSFLADLYLDGRGVEKDVTRAIQMFRSAADAGDVFAMRSLGRLYYYGSVVARDYSESIKWYQKAVDAGDAFAMVQLGHSYRDGEGVERKDEEAVRLYRLAHEQGSAEGTQALGFMTEYGRGGLEQDVTKAAILFRQAADAGNADAMRSLAVLYRFGQGVPLDYEQSREWQRRAAESGDATAARLLGEELFEGSGISGVDVPQSRRWLGRARELGLDVAATLVRATIADRGLADPLAEARKLLIEEATAGRGWAMAALAYPGPELAPIAATLDSPRWRAHLESDLPSDVLLAASEALKTGRVAEQRFDLAFALVERAGRSNRFAATSHQLRLLLDLKLTAAALRRYEQFVRSDDFKNAPPAQRRTFEQEFANRWNGYGAIDGRSLETLVALANDGVAPAAFALGTFYGGDGNSERDPAEARYWHQRAVELGSTEAMVSLGYMLRNAEGGDEDKSAAYALYRKAAAAGNTTAKLNLGIGYREGDGIPKDKAKAYYWFVRAAEEGQLTANTEVALARFKGEGTTVDLPGALSALRKGVECQHVPAIYYTARAYFEGAGYQRNPDAAWRWMRYAASYAKEGVGALGMAQAAALGWGGAPDLKLAHTWLREAKLRGNTVANAALEKCGDTPTAACLRQVEDFVPRPLMKKAQAISAAPADAAAEEAKLKKAVNDAIVGARSLVEVSVAFADLDRHYLLHDDADGVIRSQLLHMMQEETRLDRVYGSRNNYFALFDSSCRWGNASKAASAVGREEAAVLFAKVAVNRLQAARQRIADLDDDIRECFIEAHRDRYRELTGRFLELGRFEEAENVLAMLKDFEFQTYTGERGDRGRSFDPMPMTRAQAEVLRRYEEASAAFANARATAAAAAGGDGGFDASLQQLADALDALERNPQPTLVEGTAPRPARVQAALTSLGDQRAAAVQAVVQPDRVFWLVTTPTQQKVVRVAVKLPELARKVRGYRDALTSASADAKALAGELYTMIFAPVDAQLKALGAQQVLLSLDDMLRYVPFAALHDGKNWLVERYAFSMFRDTADLAAPDAPARAAQWQVAGFGVTKAVGGLDALPLVADELGGIVRSGAGDEGLLPGTVRLDESFDRGALADALSSPAEAIHIASHFVLSPKSRDGSYLLLGNGDKLPLDAFRSEAGLRFRHADFLALSACDTALSSHDASGVEIDSMAEIAQDAGAPAVLASLWPVADASTPQLMIGFYRNRTAAGAGATKAQALRQAQLSLIARGAGGEGPIVAADVPAKDRRTFDHPFFWAPFVLLGDSR